jgi:hypothetical protein
MLQNLQSQVILFSYWWSCKFFFKNSQIIKTTVIIQLLIDWCLTPTFVVIYMHVTFIYIFLIPTKTCVKHSNSFFHKILWRLIKNWRRKRYHCNLLLHYDRSKMVIYIYPHPDEECYIFVCQKYTYISTSDKKDMSLVHTADSIHFTFFT